MEQPYLDKLFARAKMQGIDELEVFIVENTTQDIGVYQGQLEQYTLSTSKGLSVKGKHQQSWGYAYSEKLTEEGIDELINSVISFAENSVGKNESLFISGKKELHKPKKDKELNCFSDEEKINFLLELEAQALRKDLCIKAVTRCRYTETTRKVYLRNSSGYEKQDEDSSGQISFGVVSERDGLMQTGQIQRLVENFSEAFQTEILESVLGDALGLLGAQSLPSHSYEVLLRNNVAIDLLSGFLPVFYASHVQRNLSLMKGKVGMTLATKAFSLFDDPYHVMGKMHRNMDDEGTPTKRKALVEKGVLKQFLHNNKTAREEGIDAAGNGFRPSLKSSVEIQGTNTYVLPGDQSLEELIGALTQGILIVEVDGLHAGIHPSSGNFSLLSKGFIIEEGRITKPVSQITIAGNFYDLIQNIKGIGKDLLFQPLELGSFGSPSLWVGKLAVAGESIASMFQE